MPTPTCQIWEVDLDEIGMFRDSTGNLYNGDILTKLRIIKRGFITYNSHPSKEERHFATRYTSISNISISMHTFSCFRHYLNISSEFL